MEQESRKVLYIELSDWTWWAWAITTALLIAGLAGHSMAFISAMLVTVGQTVILLMREGDRTVFAFQLRIAYLLLLIICFPLPMRWLYWLPTIGTTALLVFGYCLLARILSLLPWNSREPYTLDRLRRTFLSAPDPNRVAAREKGSVGSLCTIEAQVAGYAAFPQQGQ